MKVQNPIIGRARGSAGGMTFCKNYDKNVARAKAFEVSNPKTQAQQTQRNFFKQLTALCSDFSDDLLRTLFPSKPKTMSRRNALAKQIAQSYQVNGTEKTIDYADIDTLGNAPVMDFGVTTCEFLNEDISIEIDEKVRTNPSLDGFDIIFAVVNETKGEISITDDAVTMPYGNTTLNIPTGWQTRDSIHAIPLLTNSKGYDLIDLGWGRFSITKRPPRKND